MSTIPPDPRLVSGAPTGPIEQSWEQHKFDMKLVNPGNKRKFEVIVVGTGLAGASAAASMAQLGYKVKVFTFHDSPRRAHSIAAQGGINAAKNYPNDGDSIYRLFYDTVKGGDFRARESNVYRLAQVSVDIIDQCVAQGVPFAREYGGLLDNRSFGGAQVSRTFYARGQTGQQLLLGAYQALEQQVSLGNVRMYTKTEMLDVVVKDGKACGIITRDLVSGEISSHSGHAVVLATGGYSNVYYLSTNAMNCNVTAAWRAHKKGAMFANPCFTQIHPTCIPSSDEFQSKLTLMSESLRNDGRIWVPKNPDETRSPDQIPEEDRDYFLERKYPAFGNLVPRDVASRNAKAMVDSGYGVGPLKNSVYLDFAGAIERLGESVIRERYGNLFDMYERITDENPYKVPMRIYPAIHYTMGGLWVDYNLMTTVPGLYAIGEANFADQGANRLGASALMQGLADGYFVLPNTIGDYLSGLLNVPVVPTDDPEFGAAEAALEADIQKWLSVGGTKSVDHYHRELGKIMWDYCGMARDRAGLEKALSEIPALRQEFEKDVRVLGSAETVNQSLEKVQRVADFFELAELMCRDALMREESCGGHFRVEHQTAEGEAERDDEHFAFVAAWDWQGKGTPQELHKEPLEFDYVHLTQRSYK
ncbi:MAG: fumarate reductase/succinate dehydrogenase flavoprotein subunit [Acidimicrobiales bacterium]